LIEGLENDKFASVFNSDDHEANFEKHLDNLEKPKRSRFESVERRNVWVQLTDLL